MNEIDHDLIEAYYKNNLSDEERNGFKKRMESDQAFRKDVEKYGAFAQMLEASVENDLRTRLNAIDKTRGTTAKSGFTRKWIMATILGATLIIILAIWKQTQDINPQQIAANYTVYEYNDKSRNALEKIDSTLFKTYFEHMNQANAFFEEAKYAEGRLAAEKIERTEKVPSENKEWMITLSYYLENGRKDENFQRMLNKILDHPDHINYTLAVRLDNEVNSFWGRLKE